MKKFALILPLALLAVLSGCAAGENADIAATTLPVYTFTSRLCGGTGLTVARLVTESVSCLHDYTLQVNQMRTLEAARVTVINGAGLEDFLGDTLKTTDSIIDASSGMESRLPEGHDHDDGHRHEQDPHLWLSPEKAKIMAQNICGGLKAQFPAHAAAFEENLTSLLAELDALQAYGDAQLGELNCRELITFHDGFSCFAEAFGLTILRAVEEESGSEASAAELIGLIETVETHSLPAVFTEANGSVSAAGIIAAETGCGVYALDMAMAGADYFEAMYHNIDTVKEALG